VKSSGSISAHELKTVQSKTGEWVVLSRNGKIALIDEAGNTRARYTVPYGAVMMIKDKDQIEEGQTIFEWDPYTNSILTERPGIVKYLDIVDEISLREELDETTGLRQRVIVEDRDKALHPHIIIVDQKKNKKLVDYAIPTGAHLLVHDGQEVSAGDSLVKIPRDISKTRDITGGLPRVAELFEARKPRDPAVVSEIDGIVEFAGIIRGAHKLLAHGENEDREYLIPHGKHLRVRDRDRVRSGERLCEGPINPHDILNIKGPGAVQEYLVNEIQEVYRLQGVRINDKHIEVIVRQMLQKVKVEDPGDTIFLEGQQVDKIRFQDENEKIISTGGEPATFQTLLLGITKAALSTESFVSAASFQETTRVLTEAAIHGRKDQLLGLKENVIMGHLIPAGTGFKNYRNITIEVEGDVEVPEEDAVEGKSEKKEEIPEQKSEKKPEKKSEKKTEKKSEKKVAAKKTASTKAKK